jgi:hypothetical protein
MQQVARVQTKFGNPWYTGQKIFLVLYICINKTEVDVSETMQCNMRETKSVHLIHC